MYISRVLFPVQTFEGVEDKRVASVRDGTTTQRFIIREQLQNLITQIC